MRTIRALTIAAAVVAALPMLATAQGGRQFKDSWFWGVRAGGLTLADSGSNYVVAPAVGIDWMVTRKHGGVYLAASQSFFDQHSFMLRDPVTIDSGFRAIRLKNMRRFDAALLGFPGDQINVHPYVGIGFSVEQIASAVAEGPFSNVDQFNYAALVIQDEKVSITPVFMGGVQWRLKPISVFAQLTAAASQRSFIAYNGKPWNVGLDLGVRYNTGTAISRDP
ncbi:MAG TPA: hypothetical protein VIP11_06325 [Gemmatimonadaceae bacterium]